MLGVCKIIKLTYIFDFLKKSKTMPSDLSNKLNIIIFYNFYKDSYPDDPPTQLRMSKLDSECPKATMIMLEIDYCNWCKENKRLFIKN